MTGRLASKVVVVTGGGTGIGHAVAGRAVAEGAAVVIGGRRSDVGERAAADLREAGGRALFVATGRTRLLRHLPAQRRGRVHHRCCPGDRRGATA